MKNKIAQTEPELTTIQGLFNQAKALGLSIPQPIRDDYQNTPRVLAYFTELGHMAQNEAQPIIQQIINFAKGQEMLANRTLSQQQQNTEEGNAMGASANKKIFNLKKIAQAGIADPNLALPQDDAGIINEGYGADSPLDNATPDMPMDSPELDMGTEEEEGNWSTHADLKEWLDQQGDRAAASSMLTSLVSDPYKQSIVDILESYYEEGITEEDKLIVAQQIFDVLPDAAKNLEPNTEEGILEAPITSPTETLAFINDAENTIKKLAQAHINKPFNMMKVAQHKGMGDNVIMYGPESRRIDPFLKQPISDWHIVERNKGFGLVVDDIWNIDWETLWRGTIMDKFSRPYRDNEGNWVGGYLQKRFEVDKWIPEGNNYQLKPGELRRPYVAEARSTEARLEAMRKKEDRGYEPDSTGNPFNWKKEASSKKKKLTKEADLPALKEPRKPKGFEDWNGPDPTKPDMKCPYCNGTTSPEKGICDNCQKKGYNPRPQSTGNINPHMPDQPGKQSKPLIVSPNHQLGRTAKTKLDGPRIIEEGKKEKRKDKKKGKMSLGDPKSDEFKMLEDKGNMLSSDPFSDDKNIDTEDIEKSCTDLAIE